jgi:hypothetical protein
MLMVKQARSSHRFNPRRPDNLADLEEDERSSIPVLFAHQLLWNGDVYSSLDSGHCTIHLRCPKSAQKPTST